MSKEECSPCGELASDDEDPVLQMWGVGKEIWADESGDAFIARERSEWDREIIPDGSPQAPAVVGKAEERTTDPDAKQTI